MSPRRGDRVAPPARAGGWEAKFANNDAAKGWEHLCRTASAATWEAWIVLTERPMTPENPSRQHRLKRSLASLVVHGKELEQWQYEVTGSGRVLYCPDAERRIVWVVYAGTGHPKVTE